MAKQKNSKKILYLLLVVAIAVTLLFALEKLNVTNFVKNSPQPDTSSATEEEKLAEADANAKVKKQLIEDSSPPTDTPTPTTGSIELAALKQGTDYVTVFTKLHQISSGSCELTVTSGVGTDRQTAEVIYQSEYSICAGFSVPVSTLGNGAWNILLNVSSGGQTYSKTITYEVK